MATTATGARASRRAAATAVRQNIQAQPAPEAEAPLATTVTADDINAADDEAFGPEDMSSPTPTPAASRRPVQQTLPMAPQAPAPTSNSALARPQEDLTRQIGAADLVIPKLRLSQAMSKINTVYQTTKGAEGVQQGNWYHSQTGENLGETCYFIPVDMRKSRAFFLQGSGLMCRSFDLLNGEGDPGGSCEGTYEERLTVPAANRGCPLRHWNDHTPPKCGVTYNYVGLIIRESEIEDPSKAKPLQGILQFRSTATGTAKVINTMMTNEGMGVWHNLVIELGVEVKTNSRGVFYVPTADFFDTTDAEGFDRIRRRASAMSRQMGNQNLRTSLEDDDAA